jgi:SNF2 family DNA or RNA helicase
MAYQCKHIAATLITALEQMAIANLPPLTQRVAWLKEATETTKQEETHNAERWVATVAAAVEPPSASSSPSSAHSVLYHLSLCPKSPQNLILNLKIARKVKKGGFGNIQKEFSASTRTHFQALKPIDHDILHKIEILHRQQEKDDALDLYQPEYTLPSTLDPILFKQILETGRAYWCKNHTSIVLYAGPSKKGELQWSLQDSSEQQLSCLIKNMPVQALPLLPLWYINTHTGETGMLEIAGDPTLAKTLLFSPPLAPQAVSEVSNFLSTRFKSQPIPLPHVFQTQTVEVIPPKPRLRLLGIPRDYRYFPYNQGDDSGTHVLPIGRVSFMYENKEIQINGPIEVHSVNKNTNILTRSTRQFELEAEHVNRLLQHDVSILRKTYPSTYDPKIKPTDFLIGTLGIKASQEAFLQEKVPALKKLGWDILYDSSFPVEHIIESDDWYTEFKEGSEYNWFTMEMGVMVDNQKINILPLIVNLIQKSPADFTENALKDLSDEYLTLTLENEQQIRIPAARIKGILATLTELYDSQSMQNGGVSLYRSRISQVLEMNRLMEIEKMRWLGGEALLELSRKIANFEGIVPTKLPKTFKGKLRDYQQKGVDWLNFLKEYQLGGILADDMGLGKTVQTLAHIMIEKAAGRLDKPCLIIAPTSLMGNWQSEAALFAPSLKVLISQGQTRKKILSDLTSADLILTTYPLIVRDKDILLEHEYSIIILDEAQFIKNANTKAYVILQKFKSKHRLCLTGTPMENHLGELWSLFNFLSPGLLGTSKQFTQLFRTPIEKQGNLERRHSLNQRIKPYILRRTKSEVVQELPTKTEIIHHIVLEEEQRDLYESIRLAMETKVQKAVEAKGFSQSQIIILDALLKLRQACADPRLLKLEQAKKVKSSAKLSFLMSMLSELVEEGRKILLFSSFTSMLELIEAELQAESISYVKLTGSTTDRATPVKTFQAGEVSVFLISLKAGGTGLNLTTADTVIHYDPWWNPAAEAQATDRAHRIGQKKPVFVYKLVTTGTVEEKILLMQQNKRALMESLFEESESTKTRITKDDLQFLFQPIESVEETAP